ncbi:hypothetical protein XENTR_v10010918 [Xenopus tropicalis]|nr:hypothetical protein XENTR_v10010918 [Xenopus tropicalis]
MATPAPHQKNKSISAEVFRISGIFSVIDSIMCSLLWAIQKAAYPVSSERVNTKQGRTPTAAEVKVQDHTLVCHTVVGTAGFKHLSQWAINKKVYVIKYSVLYALRQSDTEFVKCLSDLLPLSCD